jgi:hypothetical protein
MKTPDQLFTDVALETEIGMFEMEIAGSIQEISGLIEISRISDDLKKKCDSSVQEFVEEIKKEGQRPMHERDIYDLCRGILGQLYGLLNHKDDEERQLFESIKDIVLKARDSVKGWKNNKGIY